tara:strand:- start:1317 stop:1523 length:207 start_codon:yes stop_codon:yes gene_type:complete
MKKHRNKNAFRYYLSGTQIAIMVFVATFVGYQVDTFFNNKKYIITILFAVTSILYALYALIKEVSQEE